MGPIRDFNFDAAILFSDLLFPLEVMGMGLKYDEGPQLEWHLEKLEDVKRLKGGADLAEGLSFQAKAIELIRKELPSEKSLLGFVGGPITLFCYAVEGSHKGSLESSKKGLYDGRFAGFFEKLEKLLVENMCLQAAAGANAVAVLDTCAGEFSPEVYRNEIVPALNSVLNQFKKRYPDTPVVYYSKNTQSEHWKSLKGSNFQCLGVDWQMPISEVLGDWAGTWAIQGNIDPHWLFLEPKELESRLRKVFAQVKSLPAEKRQGWVCGLGHGVLPKTPESNVRLFLDIQREVFTN